MIAIATQTLQQMEDTYYLQEELLEGDSDDGFTYEEVPVSESVSSGDEDLSAAVQNVTAGIKATPATASLPDTAHAEVVEDFVRNYLVQNGLLDTAGVFEREWYQRMGSGHSQLPHVYAQNRLLEVSLEETSAQLERYKEAARLAKERCVRMQKERDYHRMHHRRVVQEKDKLLSDLKRMKSHYSTYEPVLQQLQHKYQTVTREKMLVCLERDRAVSEVGSLQTTLHSVQTEDKTPTDNKHTQPSSKPPPKMVMREVPSDPPNPYRTSRQPVCAHLTRTAGFQSHSVIAASEYPISCTTLHPTKPLLVSASDDHTWRMWSIPSGELVLSGEGHNDWVSCVEYSPNGLCLASTSGDGTVKLWNTSSCINTFSEHQQPVWSCSWHWDSVLLASGGMDHTAKIWDTDRGVCVTTLRGHANSINCLSFMAYSSTLLTASADKTISLWDLRTGLCARTLYGHANSCNAVAPTLQGYEVYSCDCFGALIQWDLRSKRRPNKNWELGPCALNSLAVDPAGSIVCCASDDGCVRIVDAASDKEWRLEGDSPVLNVLLNHQADNLFSASSCGEVTIWQ